MDGTRIESHLHRHIEELLRTGLMTWDVLCENTPPYDGDEVLSDSQLPYEDVIAAGLPLERNDTVRLSNGRCYSREGLRRWAATYRGRNVRPQFPATRGDLTRVDLIVLGFTDKEARSMTHERPSLESILTDADRGDDVALRQLHMEQAIAAGVTDAARSSEVPSDNDDRSWFIRSAERPGQVKWLLRGKPLRSFLVVWSPRSQSRGSLAFITDTKKQTIERIPLRYSDEYGYSIVSVPPLLLSSSSSSGTKHFATLTLLLLDKHVHWPPDDLPFEGYHGNISKSDADRLLWPQPLGTYLVRASDRNPDQYILSVRNIPTITHAPIVVHKGPHVYGISGPSNDIGYTTLSEYLQHILPINEHGIIPTIPLSPQ